MDPDYKGRADVITTTGTFSDGILAQSVGAGGGNGGFAISVAAAPEGLTAAFAMGGKGGVAGNGGTVSLTSNANITTGAQGTTPGDKSSGLVAQSIGGAGGNGGFTVSGDFQLTGVGASVAVWGSGGAGGSAGNVTLTNSGTVTTNGTKADGELAQSIGGGGGDNGVTVAASGSVGGKSTGNIAVAVGGDGGLGGNAGVLVKLDNYGPVTATGPESRGLVAESIGGGGGDGSLTISAAIAGTNPHELALSVGGNGGVSGNGGGVQLTNTAPVQTGSASLDPVMAQNSPGIVASSGGGGDAHGSWVGSFAFGTEGSGNEGTPVQAAIAVGGTGGAAGNAGKVTLDNSGSVKTYANQSPALLGSSIGGGGDAGYLLAGTGLLANPNGNALDASVAVGRDGGGGGSGGIVHVTNSDAMLQTFGMDSDTIHVRSEGGGGGSAGAVLALTATTASNGIVSDVAVGAAGGAGSSANDVTVENSGRLTTVGQNSFGIRAESLGGAGGDGAFALSGDLSFRMSQGIAADIAVGGKGGTGSSGGDVTAISHGPITTIGDQADGISAQSIGGGGGNARWTMAVPLRTRVELSIEVGRMGGPGDNAGTVEVDNHDAITAKGAGSPGIVAQSIGGGGGNSQATSVGIGYEQAVNNPTSVAVGGTVGLPGASGGNGGPVTVNNYGKITTGGVYPDGVSPGGIVATKEYGIFAQSIGGSGGSGGSATSLLPGLTGSDNTYSITVDVGGQGGQGGISRP